MSDPRPMAMRLRSRTQPIHINSTMVNTPTAAKAMVTTAVLPVIANWKTGGGDAGGGSGGSVGGDESRGNEGDGSGCGGAVSH